MRRLTALPLLFCLLAPAAVADGLYQIEMILFRQAGPALPSGQPAADDWSAGARPLEGDRLPPELLNEAARLTPANGYQVLLQQRWQSQLGSQPERFSLSDGQARLGHFPVEGVLNLSAEQQQVDLQIDLWINSFASDGLLAGSERLRQSSRLTAGKLTYLDSGSLGLLVKVTTP